MRRPFPSLTISMVSLALAVACEEPTTGNANRANGTANTQATARDAAATAAEVTKVLSEFAAAMSKNDVIALDRVWADEFTFVSHDGEILTKAQLLEVLKAGTERFESLVFDEVDIRTYGDTAVVTAQGTQKATLEGKDHSGTSRVSIVLVEMKDGWRMVLAQLAELRQAAKAAKVTARPPR